MSEHEPDDEPDEFDPMPADVWIHGSRGQTTRFHISRDCPRLAKSEPVKKTAGVYPPGFLSACEHCPQPEGDQ